MITVLNILFGGLLFSGICLWILYAYLALWRIPKEKQNREKLSWYTMICASAGTFCFFLAWRLKEPLAKDFLPVFFILSLIVGYLFRESAISPYKLAEFWSKRGSHQQSNEEDANHKI
jgi:hypothetical protein